MQLPVHFFNDSQYRQYAITVLLDSLHSLNSATPGIAHKIRGFWKHCLLPLHHYEAVVHGWLCRLER